MSFNTILTSAAVGIITSVITAYITTHLKMKEEKEKWRRDFAVKFAEMQGGDNAHAQRIAVQFAVGVLIKNPESQERERIFMPPNCRLVLGRAMNSGIIVDDSSLSRHHCAFAADDANVYIENLGATNPIFLNDEKVETKRRLKSGDIITLSAITKFQFQRIDPR